MEFILGFVKETGSIIIAGGTICGFALKVFKIILKNQLAPFKEDIDKMDKARTEQHEETKREISILREELNRNSLNTMKNTICNENIPITERLSVGKEYIEKGGNGAVKVYVHKLEEDYENKLKSNNLTN